MRAFRRAAGFSLAEVLVSTGIVALTACTCTGALVAAQRLQQRAHSSTAALQAAMALRQELLQLPFCLAAPTNADTSVRRVFPHANANAGDPRAFFSPRASFGCPAGTFFSTVTQNDVDLFVAATFCSSQANGWAPIPLERLAEYSPACPPSACLVLRIYAAGRSSPVTVATLQAAYDQPPAGSSGS
jgi:type II secretory pathway pseudopilin PulG